MGAGGGKTHINVQLDYHHQFSRSKFVEHQRTIHDPDVVSSAISDFPLSHSQTVITTILPSRKYFITYATMATSMIASTIEIATKVAPFYIAIEFIFYIVFHLYMIPKANKLVPPASFRDYGSERTKLMVRILRRIEATCALSNKDVPTTIHTFLAEWFHISKTIDHDHRFKCTDGTTQSVVMTNFSDISSSSSSVPSLTREIFDDDSDSTPSYRTPTSLSSHASSNDLTNTSDTASSICLYKEDMDDFFAWAFFGKLLSALLPWEMQELSKIFYLLQQEHKIHFPPRSKYVDDRRTHSYLEARPRCMTLEPVDTLHRPLLVYGIVALIKIGAGLLLRLLGYSRIESSTGLVGWFKPGKTLPQASPSFLPLLFFHGIAPTGFVVYLPMILFGIATEPDRPIFLFENRSISCSIDFSPLTEDQTVQGVQEIVDQCLGSESIFSVMGHSFGSCPIAWLLKSQLAHRIQQIALIDPVAILLSEPDVMVNFLYSKKINKIRMVASSELFTEYYLRRHFAWYNSELWLDDLQAHHKMTVCLSDQDEIVNSKKVKQELERYTSETPQENKPTTLYWNKVGHGACISSPRKWKQVKGILLQQELEIVRRQR